MLCNRFCITGTDGRVTGSCLRLLGEPPHPELALHPCTENNLLWAEEEGEGHTAVCRHVAVGDTGQPPPILLTHAGAGLSPSPRLQGSAPPFLGHCSGRASANPESPSLVSPERCTCSPTTLRAGLTDRTGGVSNEDTLLLRDLSSTDTQSMGGETAVGTL